LRFTKNFHREKSARFTTAWRELRSRSLETAVAPRRTLSHPGIVTIYNFDEAGRFFDLLMEFVDGVNLRQAMKAGRSAIIVIIVRQRTGHFESGQKPTVLTS
jgi:serine/threonine protein kinase